MLKTVLIAAAVADSCVEAKNVGRESRHSKSMSSMKNAMQPDLKFRKHGSERSSHSLAELQANLANENCASVIVWKEGISYYGIAVGHASLWLGSTPGAVLPEANTGYEYVSWWPRQATWGGESVQARPQNFEWDAEHEDDTYHKVDLCGCLDVKAMADDYETNYAQHSFGYMESQNWVENSELVIGGKHITVTDAAHKAQETKHYSFNLPDPNYSCSSMAATILKTGLAGPKAKAGVPDMEPPAVGRMATIYMSGIRSAEKIWKPSDVLTWALAMYDSGKCDSQTSRVTTGTAELAGLA